MNWNDPEQVKAHKRAYYITHREEMAASNKAYRIAHKEELAAYLIAHKEEIKVRRRIYLANRREETNKQQREYLYRTGKAKPMAKSKDSSSYLGVHIAERVLSKYFDNIERMPYGHPGYDFVCSKGYNIDVKSVCLSYQTDQSSRWSIRIDKNTTADYFLILLFDNRENLNPMHILLIPGCDINHRSTISITNSEKSLAKWSIYEKSLDKVISCCNMLREEVKQ